MKGSFKLMKKLNQRNILKLIKNKGPISRAEIAERSGLAPATVSNNVKKLLEMDLIKETARGESKARGGRKPILLELNPEGVYIIGFEWGISTIRGILLNFNGEVINSRTREVENYKFEYFVDVTVNIINEFENSTNNNHKIFGVGIGIHGIVDADRGISLYAPYFSWENIKVKESIEQKIDFPVFIDNDVNVMALGEKWFGIGKAVDDFVFIETGMGVGASIILNQELYTGKEWSAGEFGHTIIDINGPRCICGNKGCLNALISLNRLAAQYNPDLDFDLKYEILKREWNKIIKNANQEDKKARKIIEQAGKYLGVGIVNLVNILNPQLVVIGGELIYAKDIIFPVIKKEVKEKSLRVSGKNLDIESASFQEEIGAIGAATMVLQNFFSLDN